MVIFVNTWVLLVCLGVVMLFTLLSLIDPPYNFLFFTELVSGWFFEIKLGNGLSHDRNRWEKIGKDGKRYKKI